MGRKSKKKLEQEQEDELYEERLKESSKIKKATELAEKKSEKERLKYLKEEEKKKERYKQYEKLKTEFGEKNFDESINKLNETIKKLDPNYKKPVEYDILELKNEDYQKYYLLVNSINYYISENFNNTIAIDLDFIYDNIQEIKKLIPTKLFDKYYLNSYVTENIKIYNLIPSNDSPLFPNQLDNLDFLPNFNLQNDLLFKILPNKIEESTKFIDSSKKALKGTNNVIFSKLENQKFNAYNNLIGDYVRIDIENALPSRLRLNDKDKEKGQFIVFQGDSKFYFSTIIQAKNFCLSGGIQADFIRKYGILNNNFFKKPRFIPTVITF